MKNNNILVSIIIVNYNGQRFLDDCISSIKKFVSVPYEIIIVDNASTDGSCAHIRKNWPEIKLVENSRNYGFTGGNNLGADHSIGRLLFLLNYDTKLLSDIKTACDMFDDYFDLGVVGGRLYYGDSRQQPSIGYEHTPMRILLSWLGARKFAIFPSLFRREIYDEISYTFSHNNVAWVSGASFITPRDLWFKLKGLDEQYFMYVEDVDYCKRVRQAGFKVAYLPDMEIIHYEGAGKAWIGGLAIERTLRSYLIYTKKFYGCSASHLLRLGLGLVIFMRALFYRSQSIRNKSNLIAEKYEAFFNASVKLFSNRFE